MPSARYQARKSTRGGWYVYDTVTGGMWPGMAHVGAVQLAAHLNSRSAR